MDNISDNLEYSLEQFAAFTQAQLLAPTMDTQNHFGTTMATDEQLPDYSFRMIQPLATAPIADLVHNKPETPTRVIRPPNAYLLFNKEMRKKLKNNNPGMTVGEISKEIGIRWKSLSPTEKSCYVHEANKLKETQKALHPNAMYIRRSREELRKAGQYSKGKKKYVQFLQLSNNNNININNDIYNNNFQQQQQLSLLSSSVSPPPLSSLPLSPSPSSVSVLRKRHNKRDKHPTAPKHPLSAYMWYLTEVRPDTMRHYPGSTVGQISKLCADRWNKMSSEERIPWITKAASDKERYAREMQIYALQNDHIMGRGTRQKYRLSAATTAANNVFLERKQLNCSMLPTTTTADTLNPSLLQHHE